MIRPVALVTGGAVRIGAAISSHLAASGWDLLIQCRSSGDRARSLARSLSRRHGVRIETVALDLRAASAPKRLRTVIHRGWGRLDGLVNNAAVLESTPLSGLDADAWDRLMALNLRAPAMLVRELLPLLRRSAAPAVVNVTDVIRAWPDHAAYVVSKAALSALTRQLAVELAPEVRVNAVAPGAILFPKSFPAAARKRIVGRIPMQRTGTPEEVAETVRFLLEGPGFITGQILAVDGGRSCL